MSGGLQYRSNMCVVRDFEAPGFMCASEVAEIVKVAGRIEGSGSTFPLAMFVVVWI